MNRLDAKLAKMDKTTKEIWIGVILLAVFLLIFYGCTFIENKTDGVVTSRFFPYILAGSGSVLSLMLIGGNLLKKYSSKEKAAAPAAEATNPAEPIRWNMIAISVVLMFVYLLLMDILGFIVSSALYLIVQILILQKDKSPKKVLMVVIISILVPLAIFLPFRYIFSLVLPMGIFRGLR